MNQIQKVADFLETAGTFSLATVDGTLPKCRPISGLLLKDDVLYFCVGTFKEVYRQMQEKPYAEIFAYQGAAWLRYYGKAVFEQDDVIPNSMIETIGLGDIYNEETGHKLGAFHLEEATAEFREWMDTTEIITF